MFTIEGDADLGVSPTPLCWASGARQGPRVDKGDGGPSVHLGSVSGAIDVAVFVQVMSHSPKDQVTAVTWGGCGT